MFRFPYNTFIVLFLLYFLTSHFRKIWNLNCCILYSWLLYILGNLAENLFIVYTHVFFCTILLAGFFVDNKVAKYKGGRALRTVPVIYRKHNTRAKEQSNVRYLASHLFSLSRDLCYAVKSSFACCSRVVSIIINFVCAVISAVSLIITATHESLTVSLDEALNASLFVIPQPVYFLVSLHYVN